MAEPKRSELSACAKTLNDLLGLEPPIDGKGKVKALKVKLTEAAGMLTPEDAIPEEVTATLIQIGALEDPESKIDPSTETEPEETKPAEAPEEQPVDMTALINGTGKLATLKGIVGEHSKFFPDLVSKLDNYKGLAGPKTLKADMFAALGVEVPVKTSAKKAKTAAKPKGKGIIKTIVECIENAGKDGIKKDEILAILKREFPDREEKSMKNTIGVQVPSRISKEKFKVSKTDSGYYFKDE